MWFLWRADKCSVAGHGVGQGGWLCMCTYVKTSRPGHANSSGPLVSASSLTSPDQSITTVALDPTTNIIYWADSRESGVYCMYLEGNPSLPRYVSFPTAHTLPCSYPSFSPFPPASLCHSLPAHAASALLHILSIQWHCPTSLHIESVFYHWSSLVSCP